MQYFGPVCTYYVVWVLTQKLASFLIVISVISIVGKLLEGISVLQNLSENIFLVVHFLYESEGQFCKL